MLSVFETRGRLSGRPAVRVDLRCAHGEDMVFLLLGRDSALNGTALELLVTRHGIRHGCRCRFPGQVEGPRPWIGSEPERATDQVLPAAS